MTVNQAHVANAQASSGPAVGFAVMTDSSTLRIARSRVIGQRAGIGEGISAGSPNSDTYASGYDIAEDTSEVTLFKSCAGRLQAVADTAAIINLSSTVRAVNAQLSNRCVVSRPRR